MSTGASSLLCPRCSAPVNLASPRGGNQRKYCSRRCQHLANVTRWQKRHAERLRAYKRDWDRAYRQRLKEADSPADFPDPTPEEISARCAEIRSERGLNP